MKRGPTNCGGAASAAAGIERTANEQDEDDEKDQQRRGNEEEAENQQIERARQEIGQNGGNQEDGQNHQHREMLRYHPPLHFGANQWRQGQAPLIQGGVHATDPQNDGVRQSNRRCKIEVTSTQILEIRKWMHRFVGFTITASIHRRQNMYRQTTQCHGQPPKLKIHSLIDWLDSAPRNAEGDVNILDILSSLS